MEYVPLILPRDARDALRRQIETHGEVASAKQLGVSRHALIRALAGLQVRRATVTQITHGMRDLGLLEEGW